MRATFLDWCARSAASVVAHPFGSMLVTLAVVRTQLGVGVDDMTATRPRYVCLEVWSVLAPRAEPIVERKLGREGGQSVNLGSCTAIAGP